MGIPAQVLQNLEKMIPLLQVPEGRGGSRVEGCAYPLYRSIGQPVIYGLTEPYGIRVQQNANAPRIKELEVFIKIGQEGRLPSVEVNRRIPFNIIFREFVQDFQGIILGFVKCVVLGVPAKATAEVTDGCGGKINTSQSREVDVGVAFSVDVVTPGAWNSDPFIVEQIEKPLSLFDDHIFRDGDLRGFFGRPIHRGR
jgi:hypothetical protein